MIDGPLITTVPVGEVFENEWNPNAMAPEMLAALVENVQRVGFVQPILVRQTDRGYEVVDGAHRLRAALAAGLEEVPVVVVTMTEAEAKLQTLALNQIKGEMEPAEVARLIAESEEAGIPVEEMVTFTGFTEEDVDGLRRLLDFDWDAAAREPGEPKPADEDWVGLTFRVPESVATVVRAELDRLLGITGWEHDHLALEAMAVNSSHTTAEEVA